MKLDRIVQRIAIAELAGIEALLEPLHALGRSAVVKAVGNDIALRALLQRVVADLLGSIQRFFKIAGLQDALLLRELAPDAGKAIGLQLDAHRHLVCIDLVHRPAGLVELRQDAEQILNIDRKSTRLNSSHAIPSRMPSSA